jgi:hypothetical protein
LQLQLCMSGKLWGRFLNRFQVENLQVVNLIGINLFTSSLKLAKFEFLNWFKNLPQHFSTPCYVTASQIYIKKKYFTLSYFLVPPATCMQICCQNTPCEMGR